MITGRNMSAGKDNMNKRGKDKLSRVVRALVTRCVPYRRHVTRRGRRREAPSPGPEALADCCCCPQGCC